MMQAACAVELGRMRKLSEAIGSLSLPAGALGPAALRRLHERVDQFRSRVIARLAGALTAVAASILVGCCAWLWASSASAGPVGPMPLWEASAVQRPADSAASAYEDRMAVWMVQDLSEEKDHGQD